MPLLDEMRSARDKPAARSHLHRVPRSVRYLLVLSATLTAATALAQVPTGPQEVAWTTFVAGPGRRPARSTLEDVPGRIDLGESAWRCGFGRARHAAISDDDWSVQRVLACRRGEATVSATASCRVHDGRVDENAATLSLGTVDEDRHVTVTLSCQPR